MGHNVRLFVGSVRTLAAYTSVHAMSRPFALTSDAKLFVVPLDDDLHDALHRAHGTGEWTSGPPLLSSGDMAFAAKASQTGPLAYVETGYFGGIGHQAAVLWQDGTLIMGPLVMKTEDNRGRPPSLWPINAVLRKLGIECKDGEDEFASFGLGFYRSNEDVWSMARQVQGAAS